MASSSKSSASDITQPSASGSTAIPDVLVKLTFITYPEEGRLLGMAAFHLTATAAIIGVV
ncbi:hypothetical protein GJ688_16335 [Heliobacillus mobilis]|uniref:Uncharacterized protein n=1 Tax=Heliobacterium mobile TaxID=28064 RepID=A0A6I3SNC3_HELMO|nr:hypothetical protein [Heliobacterium mobile]